MGKRGPSPGTGGRPKKPLADKIADGNPGKRKLTVIDFENTADLEGQPMPKPSDYLSAEQKDGSKLCAVEIYEATWLWLSERGCASFVLPQLLERFAMASARWIQCETITSQLGFLAKHPTTGAAIQSPYVAIADRYMTQSNRLWAEIYQIVKENCSGEYGGVTPQDDIMERLLNARKIGMFEKVNPCHPDKVADRIAGAVVDLAYRKEPNPKIAVEVLIGHGVCHIVAETSTHLAQEDVGKAVGRIAGPLMVDYHEVAQDKILSANQSKGIRCGDNGIFKGVPLTDEQKCLCIIARSIFAKYPFDGKYILDGERLIICQSNASTKEMKQEYPNAEINPLGDWTGGTDVDTGATNRKLGSDMADSVTGGGLHGKDLSKADVSVNIYAFLKAQATGETVTLCCAIGDDTIDGIPYAEIVEMARTYINDCGGFEKFAEWGLA